jgi:hypothetical protein
MLKIHTQKLDSLYCPHNLPGMFMPSAEKAEGFISTFPKQNGSGGYPELGAFSCIPE